jgi:hypothetical protein
MDGDTSLAPREDIAALHRLLEIILSELDARSLGIKSAVLDEFDAQTEQLDEVWEEQIAACAALSMKLRNG